jgi:hypothetical protein
MEQQMMGVRERVTQKYAAVIGPDPELVYLP